VSNLNVPVTLTVTVLPIPGSQSGAQAMRMSDGVIVIGDPWVSSWVRQTTRLDPAPAGQGWSSE
jgi:hypothetical protein